MKRRGFLSMLAGAGLGVLASRTGFGESALRLIEEESDGVALNAVQHPHLTDNTAWFLKEPHPEIETFHRELSEESIEEICIKVLEQGQARPRMRMTIMPTHVIYGSAGR